MLKQAIAHVDADVSILTLLVSVSEEHHVARLQVFATDSRALVSESGGRIGAAEMSARLTQYV